MTTKPKARKFHLRTGRSAAAPQREVAADVIPAQPREKTYAPRPAAAADDLPFSEAHDDGFGGMDFRGDGGVQPAAAAPQRAVAPRRPQRGVSQANPAQSGGERPRAQVVKRARAPDPQQMSDLSSQQEIEAIRKEGLTGRQMRIARRVAQRNGLNPVSDLDAVRQLRERGIDPFARENMLQLVAGETAKTPGAEQNQLPQTVPQGKPPAPAGAPKGGNPTTGADVAKEVQRIQRDILRRRRKRMVLLFARLMFFVMIPTFLAGAYYYRYATPMYATNSEFVIQQADGGSGGGLGGMFSGSPLATSQDAVTVQSYLQSRDAMLRLDADLGFKVHFEDESIDPLQRLEPNSTNEAAFRAYRRHVKIGFDPTEGIVKMEVIAADPETSAAFAAALISYAEQQVDSLTVRLRADQMAGARESYEDSEIRMLAAQQSVVTLQEQRGVMSAQAEASSLMSQISTFEVQLANERLALTELLVNENPNRTRVSIAEGKIQRLENLVGDLRGRMTAGGTGGAASLARVSGELMIAEQDLQTRTLLLQQSLQLLETARIEANRQVRYLSVGVKPIAPDEAAYPRALENTFLAFMIFGGIYLMLSLTASILREQVSG
jgi:capsular polysaccharide transport system permease protein